MDKFAAGLRVLLQPTTITPPPAVKAMERTSPYQPLSLSKILQNQNTLKVPNVINPTNNGFNNLWVPV